MPDPSSLTPEQRAAESIARQRYIGIGLFRLSGAFVVMFGFLIMMGRFDFVSGKKAEMLGIILAGIGFAQFFIVPRLLLRALRATDRAAGK